MRAAHPSTSGRSRGRSRCREGRRGRGRGIGASEVVGDGEGMGVEEGEVAVGCCHVAIPAEQMANAAVDAVSQGTPRHRQTRMGSLFPAGPFDRRSRNGPRGARRPDVVPGRQPCWPERRPQNGMICVQPHPRPASLSGAPNRRSALTRCPPGYAEPITSRDEPPWRGCLAATGQALTAACMLTASDILVLLRAGRPVPATVTNERCR